MKKIINNKKSSVSTNVNTKKAVPIKPLWSKGEVNDKFVQSLLSGEDQIEDLMLVAHDCVGSVAHVQMLEKIGLLKKSDAEKIKKTLAAIYMRHQKGERILTPEFEDCHSAIEHHLTVELGEIGKRVHVGRSRNDQVQLCMRLYLRDQIMYVSILLEKFAKAVKDKINTIGSVPMPGFTHLQPAMPSFVGHWLQAVLEGSIYNLNKSKNLFQLINISPLGTAAGFGTGLNLDRDYTAKLLKFSAPQRGPVWVQNSRGIIEADVINWFISISSVLEKFAWDIVLGFSNEFNFFTLPDNLTTGSSIMPQKRNPDVAELLRARGAKIKGALTELSWASGKLPSNYHRDLQYTKAPMMRAAREVADSLDMAILLINGLGVNEKRLKECLYPELYATYDAYELVAKGQSFRDAYRIIGEKVKKGGYKKVDSGKYAKFTNNILKELQSEMVLAEEVLQKIGWEIDEMMEVVDGAVKGMVGA